ncbi:uncharacterized protein F4822DRAFT_9409 [Hypoxylon trugodes]|uniref:uncharacterized protein n=1 Tax=Hypoxylon trugodes TaxID=326681 RepID=UPI00219D6605|nr:uncharacterized protein F4822DRAFT_9409 [Hypoxylon trugodes]KAI1393354.1 hypothetical protein F4822DRAFT_9409 [Hypoxylon trugodes]
MISAVRLTSLALATNLFAFIDARSVASFGPTIDSARKNGPQIFNAIHNAMREFGSALHHNGMSLFPAVIPEGVLLYHGTHTSEIPDDFDWLAFEIEHAEAFAHGRWRRRNDTGGKPHPGPPNIFVDAFLEDENAPPKDPPFELIGAGHLHVYQAARPLNVLYIDGMAAGKTDMGTLDTQDILLVGNKSEIAWNDWGRADNLCDLAREWDIQGFIRMEPGFEVIYCNFTDGLRLISTFERPAPDGPGSADNAWITSFEWARAASQRYKGIGASRVLLDYSSVFSAFFYPTNLTNPEPTRPELPRLVGASDAEIAVMRQHVADSLYRSIANEQIPTDWQGVTDMIVTRYAKRLSFMAETDTFSIMKTEVNGLLNIYIDYAETDDGFAAAQQRCTNFYLQPVRARTPQDELIQAAIENTTATICTALFKVRQLIVEDEDSDEAESVSAAKRVIQELVDILRWSDWKECGSCQPDELCFIAMWPLGNAEDHYNPSCRNYSDLLGRNDYWRTPGRTPGQRPPPSSLCVGRQSCQGGDSLSEEL